LRFLFQSQPNFPASVIVEISKICGLSSPSPLRKKPRCIQVEHLAILGAYETQTTVPDTGFWCRSGGIALGLVHRESNGGHPGNAQNGRDEFGWLLNGLLVDFPDATRLL
jgi:hypothetical protein